MGIDVSICISSPLVYSYLIYSLSPLIFCASLPPSLLNIQSVLMLLSSFLIASSPLTPCLSSPCFHHPSCLSPLVHTYRLFSSCSTALVCADVWCGACGGWGGKGIEPQSGNWSEAPQLHLTSDLATWDQSYELPAYGKRLINLRMYSMYCAINWMLIMNVHMHTS